MLASLNHPHIAQIHGLEEDDGRRFLVLELVEGETLAERIARGRIPVEKALPIALQIARALEAAHGRGIVHRDIKPANVMLNADGDAKVLDFGIARPLETAAGEEQIRTRTLDGPPTRPGLAMGTPAYMSPEQLRGERADRRSDIWAFGVTLWEMLTGARLFEGQTDSDTLAAVLQTSPDWGELPAETPGAVRRLLRRCLERDPRQRLHDIADARLEIEEALAAPDDGLGGARGAARLSRRGTPVWWRLLAALAVGALLVLGAVWMLTEAALRVPGPPVRTRPQSATGCDDPGRLASGAGDLARRSLAGIPAKEGGYLAAVQAFPGAVRCRSDPGDRKWPSSVLLPRRPLGGFLCRRQAQEGPYWPAGPLRSSPTLRTPVGATWGPDGTIVFGPDDFERVVEGVRHRG